LQSVKFKEISKFAVYHHFEIDALLSVVYLIKTNLIMASIVWDAYYSPPICKEQQKFLKLVWKWKGYKVTSFPNELAFCHTRLTRV